METEYFTRFPNRYIQGDICSKFGISRKFYITYILIDRYRSYENYSWITIREVLEFYGYKTTKHKPKAFKEILDVLEYMINNKMIKVKQDLDTVGYDTGIKITIIPENFDYPDHFCKITSSQLNTIMMNDSSINNENLLMALLYILSYIGNRPRNPDNSEKMNHPENQPEAFWRSIDGMAKELSVAKNTILKCMDWLTQPVGNSKPLLVKRELGFVQVNPDEPPKTIPNIYVLNKKGYEQEIEWAIHKMMEIYNIKNLSEVNTNDREQII